MSKSSNQNHNNFFIRQFSNQEFAISFFQSYLPESIKEQVDWESFQLAPGDFVTKALRNRKSDLLYKTCLNGRNSFFYLHLEHQRKPNKDMPFRMLRYWMDIIEQHKKQYPDEDLPLIFPMVLYQGTDKWSVKSNFHDYLDVPEALKPYTPQLFYSLMDLSHMSDDEIQGKILLRVSLMLMKSIDAGNIDGIFHSGILSLIPELLKEKSGLEHIKTLLYYLSETNEHIQSEEVFEKLNQLPETKEIKEVVMTLAEQWRLEGEQRGIEKGEYLVVTKLLKLKFQTQAELYTKKLESASKEQLDLITERILTVETIEEVFKGI